MRRTLFLVALLLIAAPAHAQSKKTHGGPGEAHWRKAFKQVQSGHAAAAACRARLPDYCSWEYWESRGETEAKAYRVYLEAKRRGETPKDLLAYKIHVPEPCQKLFDGYPGTVAIKADPKAPHSCPARLAVLTEAIDRVEKHWAEERERMETEARHAAVPRHWRD